jgi:PqqD family protein of HPr-rel-A system
MHLKKNIATSESGFIFNPSSGDSYTVNPVAIEVLQQLKQGTALAAIKENILLIYEVEPMRVEQDLEDFMNQLKEANLLEN